MKLPPRWTIACVAALLLPSVYAQTPPQPPSCKTLAPASDDALVASPANHTLLFENADIRVLDVHSQPHTREAVHTHALPSVMYIERQGAGTYDTPDGSDHRSHPTDPNYKPRVIAPKSEGPHWTENTGDIPFHAIRVEFKHPGCSLTGSKPRAPSTDQPSAGLSDTQPLGDLLFENADVRVLDIRVAPHTTSATRFMPLPGIFYVAQASPALQTLRGSDGPIPLALPAGHGVIPASARLISIANTGNLPLHLILFQLKNGSA